MKISRKFIIVNLLIAFLIIFTCFIVFFYFDYYYQRKNILNELKNINQTFLSTVDIFVNQAIENHLSSIAERDMVEISKIIQNFKFGNISKEKAKEEIKKYLKKQKIGKTGYVFIWNIKDAPNKIILDLHPEIEGEDVSYVDFVQRGAKQKNGYMEYLWANPSDLYPRYKSMYLKYIEEFDWVICYSSYKEEFYYLVDFNKFKEIVLNIKNFGSGDSYIVDYNGNMFIHSHEKGNFLDVKDIKNKYFIKEIIEKKEGVIEYYWYDYNKGKDKQYRKIGYFSNLEKFNIIIVSTIFVKDAFYYYYKFVGVILLILIVFIFITIIITLFLTNVLLKPFYLLRENVINILKLNIIKDKKDLTLENRFDFNKDEIVSFSKFFEKILLDLNEINLKLKIEYEKEKIFREEYEDQKNLLFHIMNLLPSEIITVDISGNILNFNDKFYENMIKNDFKKPEININDFNFIEILNIFGEEEDRKELFIKELISEVLKDKKIIKRQFKDIKNNDIERVYNITVIPYILEGNIKYIIFKFDDITDELKKIKREIEIQKIESLSNLIRGLSHDINNYLGALIGGTNLLKMDIEDDINFIENAIKKYSNIIEFHDNLNLADKVGISQKKELINDYKNIKNDLNFIKYRLQDNYFQNLNIISDSIKKASNLISKLSLITRKKDEEFNIFSLNEIINRVLVIIKSSIGKDVNIETFFDNSKEYFIKGLEENIESVLINLLINAYHSMTIMLENGIRNEYKKFYSENLDYLNKSKKGLRYNFIRIITEEKIIDEKNYIKITIKDNGIGIPEEIKEKIFEPFFSTKEKDKGTGLGLYIIKQIIQNHNGFIDFKSKLFEGTEFYVYLPVEKIELKKDSENLEGEKDFESESSYRKKDNEFINVSQQSIANKNLINKKNILIIDDDKNIRYFLKKSLEKKGYSVKEAENGGQGIDIFIKEREFINLIILDLIMPGLSGRETLFELYKIDKTIKVIMISGFGEDERIKECLNMGVREFLAKPFDIDVLIQKINKLIE